MRFITKKLKNSSFRAYIRSPKVIKYLLSYSYKNLGTKYPYFPYQVYSKPTAGYEGPTGHFTSNISEVVKGYL